MTTKTTIAIRTTNGTYTTEGVNIGGLAYHREYLAMGMFSTDSYGITHVASGRRFLPSNMSFQTTKQCERFINELAGLADWTLSLKELYQVFGTTRKEQEASIGKALHEAFDKAVSQQSEVAVVEVLR